MVALGWMTNALLLLAPAGAVLSAAETALLLVLAVAAVALAALGRDPLLLLAPVLATFLFHASLGRVVEVPNHAVIRDAQAGIAVGVVMAGQLAAVALGLVLGRTREHHGS